MLAGLCLLLSACGGGAGRNSVARAEAGATVDPRVAGQELYLLYCASCHGRAGEGVVGLAPDMRSSEFIATRIDEELIHFIKVGRTPNDPLNSSGLAMPAKGGYPSLTDEDLQLIVNHVRTLQKQ